MIDTIKLTLEEGTFLITDTLKLKPDAERVLKNYFKNIKLIRAVHDVTKQKL